MKNDLDLTLYAGRWVALVRGSVAGVGKTAKEARRAAQLSRPKEKPQLRFITVDHWQNHPLLRRLWRLFAGRKAKVLLVGGAVRDGLLSRPLRDFDFIVDGDAMALAAAVSSAVRGALVPLDSEREIARVVVGQGAERVYVDFARRYGDDWESDLRARDFTVNAIAIDRTGHYLDPLGGREDLAAGQLRATHEDAFRNDPLRTLRAVRLLAELDLNIEPRTFDWIQRDAALLPRVSPERIRDEFVRILAAAGAARHLGTLVSLGLLVHVLPEISATQGIEQSPPHRWNVWTHTRLTVDAVEGLVRFVEGSVGRLDSLDAPDWIWGDLEKQLGPLRADLAAHLSGAVSDIRDRCFMLKLAALLHDVGKPSTRSVGDDGRIHFFGHETVAAELATKRLRALRFSNDEIALARTIIAHHLRPGQLTTSTGRRTGSRRDGPSRRAVYRFFQATGRAGVEVGLLSLADMLATWGDMLPSRRWLRRLDVVTTLLHALFEGSDSVVPPQLINGHDLMAALEVSPGPEVGRLLAAIREAQAAGEVQSRAAALALAASLMRDR